jgi:hypothetical protein
MNNDNFFHGVRTERENVPINSPFMVTSGITFAVGAAPIHVIDGDNNVNEPLRGRNFLEAERLLGYSDDWNKYDLCEVMFSHFRLYNTSPVIFVNILDPQKHKKTNSPQNYSIESGRVILPFEAVKSTVSAESYVSGIDYELFYHEGQLIFEVVPGGAIDPTKTEISIGFDEVDPSMVTANDIIGGLDLSTNKRLGLEVIEAVFPKYRILPDICLCPNWSGNPDVAAVMAAKMKNYNGIFNGKALIDIDTSKVNFYEDAVKWKTDNAITSPRQVLCYPLVKNGGRVFHMSTHMAGLMANVDANNDGIPSESPSNKPLLIDSMALSDGTELLLDLRQANYLNANGITTALNFSNGFVLWGNYTAAFPSSDIPEEYFMYASRMFDWLSNTIILTHWGRVDGKLTRRFIESVIDIINIWLTTLITEQHLIGGRAEFPSELNNVEDFRTGRITFKIFFAPPGIAQEIVHVLSFDPSYIEALLSGLGGIS